MEIDEKKIKKIAMLARIKLNEKNIPELQKDLNRIVSFVDKMAALDIAGIEEFKFGETSLREMRMDETKIENNPEEILSNTKEKKEDFFVVPKIVE